MSYAPSPLRSRITLLRPRCIQKASCQNMTLPNAVRTPPDILAICHEELPGLQICHNRTKEILQNLNSAPTLPAGVQLTYPSCYHPSSSRVPKKAASPRIGRKQVWFLFARNSQKQIQTTTCSCSFRHTSAIYLKRSLENSLWNTWKFRILYPSDKLAFDPPNRLLTFYCWIKTGSGCQSR